MRIATFNVRHCTLAGPGKKPDIEATAHAARSLRADVLAVQELDVGLERTGEVHQPDTLALLLGMHVAFAPAIGSDAHAYGIALFSRTELDGGAMTLPGNEDREPRVLWAGRTAAISVVTTHLSTESSLAVRQLGIVVDTALSLPPPRLVLGDLNLGPEDLTPAYAAGFRQAVTSPTWPRRHPRRAIDHVLVQDDITVTDGHTPLLPVSDHRPLAVEIEARPADAPS
ncbi:MAG: endonuclease/exonuclease/phosphatase family protein [Acidimicrobiia bacterium]|nr:endonuclease/exonuclease/phosphatase family protein [Acidimicrobiia bacterium]